MKRLIKIPGIGYYNTKDIALEILGDKATEKQIEEKMKELEENEKKLEKIDKINEDFEYDIKIITDKYPLSERETWGIQKEQSLEFLKNKDESKVTLIVELAKANNTTTLKFAKKVLSKVKEYEILITKQLAKNKKRLMKFKKFLR